MAGKIKELVPAGQGKETPPARREEEYPLYSLQRDVNRLFEDFFRGFDLRPLRMAEEKWGGFNPKMDLEETEKEYRKTVPSLFSASEWYPPAEMATTPAMPFTCTRSKPSGMPRGS